MSAPVLHKVRDFTLIVLGLAMAAPGFSAAPNAEPLAIVPDLVHLRSGKSREWSDFSESPQAEQLEVKFQAVKNDGEWSLHLRQEDVKQTWRVSLNDQVLGTLPIDENDQVVYFAVPAGTLVAGENVLKVAAAGRGGAASDDIRVGQVQIKTPPLAEVLNQGRVEVEVLDAGSRQPLPCRLTILNADGALQTTGATSDDELAVRPGVIYAAQGRAKFGLPAGRYTIYAGRGFEYSLAKAEVSIEADKTTVQKLSVRREVPTEGYAACDTHVHTVTFSGHGDATIAERMITLAGEGIELPIATDHNLHVDYESHAKKAGLRQHFTPVIGNEVTTGVGHFNIFPVEPNSPVPDHKPRDWGTILDGIFATPGVKIAILNHPRDLHGGTRPFGPKLHNAVVGENLDGWPMRFNAMEVVNSGATQTDALQLFHDWMGLLNRGLNVTPVGGSDSHDVARHFVGQARTYIRVGDRDPGKIDVAAAANNFLQGRVLVSYGLIAEMTVDGKFNSGDLAPPAGEEINVAIRVLGPHWTEASRVLLYRNGWLVHEETVSVQQARELPPGVKYQVTHKLPRLAHDSHLVAIALGPGIDGPWWKTARPYQPTSPDWKAQVIGCSGAVRLDGDGDGRWSSPRDNAQRLVKEAGDDLARLAESLGPYDEATAAQAAHLVQTSGKSLLAEENAAIVKTAPDHVQRGFRDYLDAWRECEQARAAP